jgi:hypothetical protein
MQVVFMGIVRIAVFESIHFNCENRIYRSYRVDSLGAAWFHRSSRFGSAIRNFDHRRNRLCPRRYESARKRVHQGPA